MWYIGSRPSYSLISVNVGLRIHASLPTSKPSATPRAKQVLPLPNSPVRPAISPPFHSFPSLLAQFRVLSPELDSVVNEFTAIAISDRVSAFGPELTADG